MLSVDDAVVAAKSMADSRMTATESFHQRGYAEQKATLDVKDGDKLLATSGQRTEGAWRGKGTEARASKDKMGWAGVRAAKSDSEVSRMLPWGASL